MQHIRFKAQQTAAHYVAHRLDDETQEAFELHMMDCAECVSDVEVWRTLKENLPEAANEQHSSAAPREAAIPWRMAASLIGVALLGGAGGWLAHGARGPGPALAAGEALFYNLPPTSRGVACTPLPLNPSASVVMLRIPDATPGATVVARSADGSALGAGAYSVRAQDDGSWVLQFAAAALRHHEIALTVQPTSGAAPESLGCITGTEL